MFGQGIIGQVTINLYVIVKYMQKVRIGTRGSKLALWQAEHIADLLEKGGLPTEIVKIDTKGDKILDVTIAKIGSKGVFTEEIEAQLAAGHIDIAVHSAKDMQSVLPQGFEIIAFTTRERPNDVLVSHLENFKFETDSALTIGTASTRRVALLKRHYPQVKTVSVRGNLQTRIAKMKAGACDALMLAYAGIHRMGYQDLVKTELSLTQFVPAVGQGSIAIECASNIDPILKSKVVDLVNHAPTAQCLQAERAFLRTLQGGCSIPVFALAKHDPDQKGLAIAGGIISLDGEKLITNSFAGKPDEAVLLGKKLADDVLAKGGDKILEEIKAKQALPSKD